MTIPALLSHGFRPFFLVAAIWGGAAVPLWLLAHSGSLRLSNAYGDLNWHAHELIFGYAVAVVCGFLLTAIPNWTGRLPVRGWRVLMLALVWGFGRIAMLCADTIGISAVAAADLLFLIMIVGIALREIIAGRNWRNLRVLVPVGALLAGNILFHVSVLSGETTDLALRISIAALIALVALVGGRITPSFTRNWLAKQKATHFPAPFDRLDALALAVTLLGLLSWAAIPDGAITATLAFAAAALLALRLLRWRGWATWREPLLAILHVGYSFVPIGFLLLGLSVLGPDLVPAGAALHAWTAGAIGTMTLAVMTRTTLGHTGRDLTASRGTVGIYAAMIGAALLRVAAPFAPSLYLPLLVAAAVMWSVALFGFVVLYGPILTSARSPRVRAQA